MKLETYKASVGMLIDHVAFNGNIDARIAARQQLVALAVALHEVVEADSSLKLSIREKQDRRERARALVKSTTEGK